MKTIQLVFKEKETSTYIDEIIALTEYTEQELQEEINRILQNTSLLQDNIYYDVVNKILQILFDEGIIRFPGETFNFYI